MSSHSTGEHKSSSSKKVLIVMILAFVFIVAATTYFSKSGVAEVQEFSQLSTDGQTKSTDSSTPQFNNICLTDCENDGGKAYKEHSLLGKSPFNRIDFYQYNSFEGDFTYVDSLHDKDALPYNEFFKTYYKTYTYDEAKDLFSNPTDSVTVAVDTALDMDYHYMITIDKTYTYYIYIDVDGSTVRMWNQSNVVDQSQLSYDDDEEAEQIKLIGKHLLSLHGVDKEFVRTDFTFLRDSAH